MVLTEHDLQRIKDRITRLDDACNSDLNLIRRLAKDVGTSISGFESIGYRIDRLRSTAIQIEQISRMIENRQSKIRGLADVVDLWESD